MGRSGRLSPHGPKWLFRPVRHDPRQRAGPGRVRAVGWYANETVEDLIRQWLAADAEGESVCLAAAIPDIAWAVPLGVFLIRGAYRSDLTGIVEGCASFP